jgi:hypothetical protein
MFDKGATTAEAPATIPDHAMLVATVAVRQAGTRTAQIAGRIAVREGASLDPVHALVATFRHADTAAAQRALAGSFHPGVARATSGVSPSTLVNSRFTLGF